MTEAGILTFVISEKKKKKKSIRMLNKRVFVLKDGRRKWY